MACSGCRKRSLNQIKKNVKRVPNPVVSKPPVAKANQVMETIKFLDPDKRLDLKTLKGKSIVVIGMFKKNTLGCSSCKHILSSLTSAYNKELLGLLNIYKIDAGKFVNNIGVKSVPTTVVLRDGVVQLITSGLFVGADELINSITSEQDIVHYKPNKYGRLIKYRKKTVTLPLNPNDSANIVFTNYINSLPSNQRGESSYEQIGNILVVHVTYED